MVSESKIISNRENAQLSTGPRTPEGKARVSQNALKFGTRSQNAVSSMENDRAYQELLNAFLAEWQPANLTEEDLVEQMVVAKWKLARYEGAESQAVAQSTLLCLALQHAHKLHNDPKAVPEYHEIISKREADAERSIGRISQLISRVERSYHRALSTHDALAEMRVHAGTQFEPTVLDALEAWALATTA